MERTEIDRLISEHIAAEMAANPQSAVAMYTEDIEHDVVGFPGGPSRDKAGAQGFYEQLIRDFHTEKMTPTHRYYGSDFCVMEHECTGTVPGSFLGVEGGGKRIVFRLLHVWEFRDHRISRENVWLDGGSIIAQLTAPSPEN